MARLDPKPGRGRRYDTPLPTGYPDRETAQMVAGLDELSERLFDLVDGIPTEALDAVPDGAGNSIALLVLHMAWAECHWISRGCAVEVPLELVSALAPGQQAASGELDSQRLSTTAEELERLCRRVREEVTKPALQNGESLDQAFEGPGQMNTLRRLLLHLLWHWTYHTGQVGLLRRIVGERYQWTFG